MLKSTRSYDELLNYMKDCGYSDIYISKVMHGFTKEAVTAILAQPDLTTKTGKRDIVFLTLLYATAGRLDEIRSIKITHIHLHTIKPYVNLQGKGNKTRTAYLCQELSLI